MKRIKTIATVAALCFSYSLSIGQTTLVAGWDFSQFQVSGFNTVDGSSFTGSISANYSDFYTPSPDIAAAAQGTLYYDGQFGSTLTNYNVFTGLATVAPTENSLISFKVQAGDGNPFSDASSYQLLAASGQQFQNDFSLRSTGDVSLVFFANAGSSVSDWQINFAALDTDNATISWEYSMDGSTYNAASTADSLIGSADAGYTAAFPELDGQSMVYLRANLSGASGGVVRMDNVGISAVVPEPSTYALIFGTIALAVLLRRRFNSQ